MFIVSKFAELPRWLQHFHSILNINVIVVVLAIIRQTTDFVWINSASILAEVFTLLLSLVATSFVLVYPRF